MSPQKEKILKHLQEYKDKLMVLNSKKHKTLIDYDDIAYFEELIFSYRDYYFFFDFATFCFCNGYLTNFLSNTKDEDSPFVAIEYTENTITCEQLYGENIFLFSIDSNDNITKSNTKQK